MPRNSLLLVFLGLMGAHLPFTESRRAVGKRRQEERVQAAVKSVPSMGVQRVVDDSDEWGEEEEEEDEEDRDENELIFAAEARREAENDAEQECSSSTDSCSFDSDVLRGPVPLSVVERGLLTTEASSVSILKEHQAWHLDEKSKIFRGDTLGFVTPWHGTGYDFARTFRSKLTYVSPVWYQLRGGGGNGGGSSMNRPEQSFSLTGGHDFDGGWVSDVRNGVGAGVGGRGQGTDGSDEDVTKIVPRVVLELPADVRLSQADLRELAELVVVEAVQRGYDGYVLDIPLSDGIEEFVGRIKTVAMGRGKELILIQSVRPGVSLSAHLRKRLVPLIHRFSLMTYDYRPQAISNEGNRAGGGGVPNSPLSWVRECVETFAPGERGSELRSMTLIGLPFYGYDNGRATTSGDIVSLFTAEQQRGSGGAERNIAPISLDWDPVWREHVMSYLEGSGGAFQEHLATFPTLAFIQERLDLAQQLGVGVALWELGQGMPYFFDLL